MFTIKEFLALDLITWHKNLTDSEIPGDRPIQYVSVNDLPLDDFIRKNEMVISIATPYVKDESLMTQFIEGLIKARASIFILAIPGDIMSLSEENKRLAERGSLPILQIPWDVRFADICEIVLDKIHSDYNEDVEKATELQTEILKKFLDGADIKQAANTISRKLKCIVSITDNDMNVVGGSKYTPNMVKIPLESSGHLYGYLCLDSAKAQKDFSILSYSLSPLLSLWFYRNEIIETTQLTAKDDFIWGLANGSSPDSEKTQRAANLMGFHLNRPYACIVGRVQLKKSRVSDEWQKDWLNSNINMLRRIFADIAKASGKETMVTCHSNAIIIYLEVLPSAGKNQISSFLDTIEERLNEASKNLRFSWGISEIKDGPADFRNYYLHAKLAEGLCYNNMRFIKRYYYENTIIYEMMATLSSDDKFMKTAYDILAPIIEYDKTKSTNLMNTLRIYLSCKNINEMSRRLNKHRQTLIYQLDKIEDLTGMSLKNNDELFLLELCTRLQFDLTPSED